MTELWMGYTSVAQLKNEEQLLLTGDRHLAGDVAGVAGIEPLRQDGEVCGVRTRYRISASGWKLTSRSARSLVRV